MLPFPPSATISQLVEAAAGYPQVLFRIAGHPVVWIGALVSRLDRLLNRNDATARSRRGAGILCAFLVVALPGGCAALLQHAILVCLPRTAAICLIGILAAFLPAQRSLHAHVRAVADGLDRDLASGRRAVSMIVGRDTAGLDQAAVARAAIESLAENFSDGVVAPLFWCALFGLPGIVVYKAANTADSMIGHRTPRHEAFGWAAARFDDLINLPASRLSALLLLVSAPHRATAAVRSVLRDAGRHRSPNAGWPEAAMAGALGLRLAGPRAYHGRMVVDHWMGDGTANCDASDIRRALRLYRRACAALTILLVGVDLMIWRIA